MHRLENLARGTSGDPLDGWQVVVDAVDGRLHPFRDGLRAEPSALEVRHCYGGTADVGAGSHDRTLVHEQALADDPYRGDPARGGPGVTGQDVVLAEDPAGLARPGVAEALDAAEGAWDGPESPAGGTYVVAIGDSARYAVDPVRDPLTVPEATRLVVVAAMHAGQLRHRGSGRGWPGRSR